MGTTAAIVGGGIVSGLIGAKGAKDAAGAQVKGNKEAAAIIAQAAEDAKKEIIPLFNNARRDAQAGFNESLDVIGQAVPAQIDALSQGSINAQETRIAGLDPFRQAILGVPTDLSGLQPKGVNVDTSFLQRQSPVKPPASEEAMQFKKLIDAFKRDPVGTTQFFEGISEDRQASIDQNIPLSQIQSPLAEVPQDQGLTQNQLKNKRRGLR